VFDGPAPASAPRTIRTAPFDVPAGRTDVVLASEAFPPPGDPRNLGIALRRAVAEPVAP
jgi:hypothetical protein